MTESQRDLRAAIWMCTAPCQRSKGEQCRPQSAATTPALAGASAPGSLLIAMSVTDETIVNIQRNGSASELLSTWKFGCPPDPSEVGAEARFALLCLPP